MDREVLAQMLELALDNYSKENEITRDVIVEQAKELVKSPLFCMLTNEDVEYACNLFERNHYVKHEIGQSLIAKGHKKWYLNRKSELDMDFWNAYKKYLLNDAKFAKTTVQTLDENLDNIVDLLGDPQLDDIYHRKGLIIGDVQSGKTSNYIGLINKACDAGYNVIILLTGTIERLRIQTQQRVDEGFVGKMSAIDNKRNNTHIGVGRSIRKKFPMALTTTLHDFNVNTANSFVADINNINSPVILVIKKNTKIMENLGTWLQTSMSNRDYINSSLLMIDDECDYASVNTNEDEEPLTATPEAITKILNMFKHSSYVGFTATPYANIFINPLTDQEMIDSSKSDKSLFPKDFIYCLKSSSEYIGPDKIFGDEAEYSYYLNNLGNIKLSPTEEAELAIDDVRKILPLKHKINYTVDRLPKSLIEAIDLFFAANVIRDIKGDIKKHRTMMINVSRFISVQQNMGALVAEYVDNLQRKIKLYANMPFDTSKKYFDDFIETLNKHYGSILEEENIKIEDFIKHLKKSCSSIVVKVVNSNDKMNKLDYENYIDNGLRVIAIGGQGLSRGLTLEGLIISYFYRNSATYDTLMQMGRWFGYRFNYEKLCRIWMPTESISWYKEISTATNELKDDVFKYQTSGLTPLDFGLRVRRTTTALLVTARNKMRATKEVVQEINMSENIVETKYLSLKEEAINNNHKTYINLLSACKNLKIETMNNRNGYLNVDKNVILQFLKGFIVPDKNISFINNAITTFIENYQGGKLDKWDVMIMSGESDNSEIIETINRGSVAFNRSLYSFRVLENDLLQIGANTPKLGNNYDFAFGLDETDYKIEKQKKNSESRKALSRKEHFSLPSFQNRHPLLVIYNIDLKCFEEDSDEKKLIAQKYNNESKLVGFVIGVPKLEGNNKFIKYVLNKVAIDNMGLEEGETDE